MAKIYAGFKTMYTAYDEVNDIWFTQIQYSAQGIPSGAEQFKPQYFECVVDLVNTDTNSSLNAKAVASVKQNFIDAVQSSQQITIAPSSISNSDIFNMKWS